MYSEDKKEAVFARLRLAQQLLEESDNLAGREGYDFDGEKWWYHPRHEREALVAYLLLTCFDFLGQSRRFITYGDWIKSKKKAYTDEKNEIINSITEQSGDIELCSLLYEKYQSIYGVRNSFYSGVTGLPAEAKAKLLKSVGVSFNPEYGTHGPNVSTPSRPLDDAELELDLKLKYLYKRRNGFTHKLEQYQSSSVPMLSERGFTNGSSWGVMIRNYKLFYMGSHQEHDNISTGGAYVYSISDWPFALFESLYEAIEIDFERTSIDLRFRVMVYADNESTVTTYNDVKHKYLKDCESFLKMVSS